MTTRLLLTALLALTATIAFAAPAAARSVDSLARAECRDERGTDRADFIRDYGGTGDAAFRRCVRDQKRDARRDCREDRREEPSEFRAEYGTGKPALVRCVKDELR